MAVEPKPWSKAELEALLVTHKTWTKVARYLGTPRTTLMYHVSEYGLDGKRTPEALSRLPAEKHWMRDRERFVRELTRVGSIRKFLLAHEVGHDTAARFMRDHKITPDEWVPKPIDIGVRRYDQCVNLEGDWCVSSDYQAPFTDELFVGRMAREAQAAGITNLLIAGDFVDLHNFSRFDPTSEQIPWSDTRTYLEKFVGWLRDVFPGRIVWTVGNHEDRLPRATGGKIGVGELARMIGAVDELFEVVDAPMIDVGDWRVVHPKSFSITPGAVARKLASKHLKNILCAHGHHTSSSWDVSGRFRCIDLGGMFDPGRLEYIHRAPSTYPLLNQGFVLLKDGHATLIEP